MIDEFRAGKEKFEMYRLPRLSTLIKIIDLKKIPHLPKTGTNPA